MNNGCVPLFRSRDGEAGRGRPSADEEAQEEDGREAERPWLANHVIVKIIDKKLRGGRCAPDQPYREVNASSGSVRPAFHALFVVLVMWRLSSPQVLMTTPNTNCALMLSTQCRHEACHCSPILLRRVWLALPITVHPQECV